MADIRNVLNGEWVEMFDNHENRLAGIRGRIGVSAIGVSGHEIGLDLMEIQPGSGFPLHTHAGDHVMYIVSGRAVCQVDGKDNLLKQGDSIYVPAEFPHAFSCPPDATDPVVFIAVGHPHRSLSSTDRMRLVAG